VHELPSFDLVVGTLGRVSELERLLDSLARQTHPPRRVFVVDQTDGNRMAARFHSNAIAVPLEWLRSEPGLSRARNLALAQVAADVVAFPDDDCTYPSDLLERAGRALAARPEVDLLAGRTADGDGRVSARWHPGGPVALSDVWHAGNSASLFVRRALLERIGGFDERLGLGAATPWTSTEDVELVVRALRAGARVEHDPSLVVVHPLRDPTAAELVALGTRDGGSVGFVLGLHGLGPLVRARMFTRPLGGAALALARGDIAAAHFNARTWRARLRGYRAGRRARVTSSSNSAV
jgi:glycosyltransferase involved in cell wall biosynthesis